MLVPPLFAAAFAMPHTGAGVAFAAPSAEAQARELFQKAEVHFNLGEFEKALTLYSEAYRLKPLPGFLFNIAQCHRFMERFEDAAFSFRVYLDRAPEAANRADVELLIAQMEQEVARRAPSLPETKTTPPLGPPAVSSTPAPPPVIENVEQSAPPAAQAFPGWFWPTISGGLVLVGAGVVTGQMASNRSEDYRDASTPVSERRGLKDSGESLATAAVVCFGAGGLALAAAVGLWLGAPAQTERPNVAAALVSGGGVLTMSGAF